ncbi:hypothetical protein SISNIDRAFT_487036 [Sistotremastrum niveocremeum HHB9708]|uniref:Uncharacterized protein n=1 Tax=Sistotremastrum niveocremeum HHB9708 TaxID=1314777 RepID=A0A164SR60_9AGAM|nr:hypothetical protein SISNIDRAFT_487036 [Sistotremastrum niveocremeum HHB9708]
MRPLTTTVVQTSFRGNRRGGGQAQDSRITQYMGPRADPEPEAGALVPYRARQTDATRGPMIDIAFTGEDDTCKNWQSRGKYIPDAHGASCYLADHDQEFHQHVRRRDLSCLEFYDIERVDWIPFEPSEEVIVPPEGMVLLRVNPPDPTGATHELRRRIQLKLLKKEAQRLLAERRDRLRLITHAMEPEEPFQVYMIGANHKDRRSLFPPDTHAIQAVKADKLQYYCPEQDFNLDLLRKKRGGLQFFSPSTGTFVDVSSLSRNSIRVHSGTFCVIRSNGVVGTADDVRMLNHFKADHYQRVQDALIEAQELQNVAEVAAQYDRSDAQVRLERNQDQEALDLQYAASLAAGNDHSSAQVNLLRKQEQEALDFQYAAALAAGDSESEADAGLIKFTGGFGKTWDRSISSQRGVPAKSKVDQLERQLDLDSKASGSRVTPETARVVPAKRTRLIDLLDSEDDEVKYVRISSGVIR